VKERWLQLGIATSRDESAAVEQALLAAGALSVWLEDAGDQPILEPAPGTAPLWDQVRVIGLLDATATSADVLATLGQALTLEQLLSLRSTRLAEQDWQARWRATLRPLCFAGRLWICPTGHACPDPAAARVLLDPGLAFGTGSHATTSLCLEWLATQPLAGQALLDYGCGSGILALAAIALGASEARAIDLDPQALSATATNAHRNGCGDRVHTGLPDELLPGRFGFIVANILSNTLVQLAPVLCAQGMPGARYALSGVLESQSGEVIAAWQPRVQLAVSARRDGWVLLTGQLGG
jgi:ribosomal protein L11 methyltransferase